MMRKIIANMLISLDGVVDEPGSWHFPSLNDEMGAAVDAVLGRTDTLLLGRKTYDDHAPAWPEREAAGGGGRRVRQGPRRRTQTRDAASHNQSGSGQEQRDGH
jgi:hypothetical protein